jgi:hypothetical protein
MVDVAQHGAVDLESLLRRIIRGESGLTPVVPAEKWRGGSLVLRPCNQALQERSRPIETFFQRIVMRNRLRTLEQQINALEFNIVVLTGWSFASSCSPSRLSATLLLSATKGQLPLRSGLSPNCWSALVGTIAAMFPIIDREDTVATGQTRPAGYPQPRLH